MAVIFLSPIISVGGGGGGTEKGGGRNGPKKVGRREKLAQKVGRREKLAQEVGGKEIYSPVPPPSRRLVWTSHPEVSIPYLGAFSWPT